MKSCLFFIFLFISQIAIAQGVLIKGRVTDSSASPLQGVNIILKGSSRGVISGSDGEFAILVPATTSVLVFSSMGYKPVEIPVGSRRYFDVSLLEDNNLLSDVVVIGYGTVRRRDLTGAVSSVKGADLEKMPVQNVAGALAGRLAGVQVSTSQGTPGANISIIVRGGGSITQSNQPLYVVDGIPQTEGLNFLDPTDIETIDVLKDASATAIYGARGANGVVLVTTKKAKPGKTRVSYDMYMDAKTVNKYLPVLSPYEYTLLQYERSLGDATRMNSFVNNYGTYDKLEELYAGRDGISWQREVFGQPATNQYHKIGVNGGNKETQFNLFYSYNNDKGIMLNSGAKKNIAKLTLNHKANERLSVSGTVNYSQQKTYGVGTSEGNTYFNQLQNILTYRPTFGLRGADEDLVELEEDPALENVSGNTLQNPKINALSQQRNVNNKTLVLNGAVNYRIIKNISYRGVAGYRNSFIETSLFNDSRSVLAKRNSGPFGYITNNERNGWNYSNTLNYSNLFNKKHKLDVLIGQEQIYSMSKVVTTEATGFSWENLGLWDLGQAAAFVGKSYIEDDKMFSLFSRLNYGFDDKYLLSASFRADGSSKFGSDNKFGYFPSVALVWRVTKERFMENNRIFSDLKLRLSYGSSGNNRIPNYTSLALLATGNYPLNDMNHVTVFSNVLPNPQLKWEQTNSRNIGLDMGFLNQRIQLTTDFYINKTKDLLLRANIPTTMGYSSMLVNAGSTQNSGLEFSLNSINVRRNNFEWTSSFNISFNRNKVLSLTSGNTIMYATSGWGVLNEADYLVEVGKSLGQMYGYQSDGLYQVDDFDYNAATNTYTLKEGLPYDPNNRPQPGFLKLVDRNGDSLININDRMVIGNANPKHTGGLNNTFRYKAIDLGIFINWSYGNHVYNANKLYNSQTHLDYRNSFEYIQNRWISINKATGERVTDPAKLAALNQGKNIPVYNGSGTNMKFYDQMVEDGSFLRIANINIGYTLPKKILSRVKINSLRVYFTANNVYTFTKYTGYDPEVSTRNSTGLTPGVDFGAYPRTRSFVFGANVTF